MKKVEITSENKNYTAVNIGQLNQLSGHSLIHPKTLLEVSGKVFVKEPTKATGSEISFQVLPPHSELPYFHIHHEVEETYIIIKGSGDYQVDDDCFPISEGSVIRVAPEGKRGFRNTSDEDMIVIVIQAKENSLGKHTTDDGTRTPFEPLWK